MKEDIHVQAWHGVRLSCRGLPADKLGYRNHKQHDKENPDNPSQYAHPIHHHCVLPFCIPGA